MAGAVNNAGDASAWHHARLESYEDRSTLRAQVSIDFTTHTETDNSNKPTTTDYADNVWVNIRREDLDPTDKVEAVITNQDLFVGNSNSGHRNDYSERRIELVLAPAENGRFTGVLPSSLRIHAEGYGGTNRITQKVELEINDVPQRDPVQQRHNPPYFNVDLSKAGPE